MQRASAIWSQKETSPGFNSSCQKYNTAPFGPCITLAPFFNTVYLPFKKERQRLYKVWMTVTIKLQKIKHEFQRAPNNMKRHKLATITLHRCINGIQNSDAASQAHIGVQLMPRNQPNPSAVGLSYSRAVAVRCCIQCAHVSSQA